jgi:hypothetical protein
MSEANYRKETKTAVSGAPGALRVCQASGVPTSASGACQDVHTQTEPRAELSIHSTGASNATDGRSSMLVETIRTSTGAPATKFADHAPKKRRQTKPKNELDAIRDALPFFRKGRGKVDTSWWNVTPSGNYVADLETGKKYARQFFPMLTFNAGASTLGVIVSDMAKAGRDLAKDPKQHRGIDAIALGFLMEIGGRLQSAIAGIAIAAVAIEKPDSSLGPDFLKLVKAGDVFNSLNRSTFFHNPNASIFDVPAS